MTPRKAKTRHRSVQSIQQQSDYDTDPNASVDLPTPPPLRTTNELNLSVLRRHNADIDSILSIAPFAVVYTFPAATQEWEKCGIEGTLFVCQLTSRETDVERYAVIILNRRGLDNFTAELFHGDDVEITPEYVILRVGSGQEHDIYGLWIFSEPPPSSTANTRVLNAQIIQDCAVQAETSRKLAVEKKKYEVQETRVLPEEAPAVTTGRRLSIRELFGAPREQCGVQEATTHVPRMPSTQFTPSADTEFFRSTIRPSQMHRHPGAQRAENQRRDEGISLDCGFAQIYMRRQPGLPTSSIHISRRLMRVRSCCSTISTLI